MLQVTSQTQSYAAVPLFAARGGKLQIRNRRHRRRRILSNNVRTIRLHIARKIFQFDRIESTEFRSACDIFRALKTRLARKLIKSAPQFAVNRCKVTFAITLAFRHYAESRHREIIRERERE